MPRHLRRVYNDAFDKFIGGDNADWRQETILSALHHHSVSSAVTFTSRRHSAVQYATGMTNTTCSSFHWIVLGYGTSNAAEIKQRILWKLWMKLYW